MLEDKKSKTKNKDKRLYAGVITAGIGLLSVGASSNAIPVAAEETKVLQAPSLDVEEQVIPLGATFSPTKGLSAVDSKGVDLTNIVKITIKTPEFIDENGKFKRNVSGSFEVEYQVEDRYGKKTTKTITHTVSNEEAHIEVDGNKKLLFPVGSGNGVINESEIMSGVKGYIKDSDGNIVKELNMRANVTSIDTSEAKEQVVVYEAEAYPGVIVRRSVAYVIEDKVGAPTLRIPSDKIKVNYQEPSFNPLEGVTATSATGEDLSDKIVMDGEVDTSTPGVYEVTYSVTVFSERYQEDITVSKKITFLVADGEGPVINAKDLTVEAGSKFNPLDGVTAIDEIDGEVPVEIAYNDVVLNKKGTYKIEYKATDLSGNETTKTITVRVVDTTPPKAKYIGSQSFEYGESVDHKSLFEISDNLDQAKDIKFEVLERVNTKRPGVQTIKIRLTDTSGNTAVIEQKVTVKEEVRPEEPNTPPVITASDIRAELGSTVNFMSGVRAHDKEDGDLSHLVTIVEDNVDRSRPGTYTVTYSVTDSKGATTLKTINVVIYDGTPPVIQANNLHVVVGKAFNPMNGLTSAYDELDGDLTSRVTVKGFVDVGKPGEYTLTYSVVDNSGNLAQKSIKVFVHDSDVGPVQEDKPIIFAEGRKLVVGSKFNPMAGVAALDETDGDITANITVDHNVNVDKVGVYQVTYTVTNSRGKTNSLTTDVEVITKAQAEALKTENNKKEETNTSALGVVSVQSVLSNAAAAIAAIPILGYLVKRKED